MYLIIVAVLTVIIFCLRISLKTREPILRKTTSYTLISTRNELQAILESLEDLPRTPPSLYCDIEGNNLSRLGSVSIFSLYVLPLSTTYLIDIYKLGEEAFTAQARNGITLKEILEDPDIPKVFFDVRNDSDALYAHYSVALAGIVDLQLMEIGSRYGGMEGRKYVAGLQKCIDRHAKLLPEEKARCIQIKERGAKLFKHEHGGRYEVFDERPLRKEIVEYCTLDVTILPRLYETYDKTLRKSYKKQWRQRVAQETLRRVRDSQDDRYQPMGPHKVLGPWQT